MPTAVKITARCLDCGASVPFDPAQPRCPKCGSEWLQAEYDYDLARTIWLAHLHERPFSLWRYHELLPIREAPPTIAMGAGGTPLLRSIHLAPMLKLSNLFIKDERQNPTSSFKDRQAAVTIATLKEAGLTEMVVASTGNVAIAYSAFAARAGIKLWAFLTSLVPQEKMREVAIYGTRLVKVTATYDETKKVAAEFARQRGLYIDRGSRSIPTVESMKTLAFEIVEQLTQFAPDARYGRLPWRVPDWYIQAVSGGLGPLGVAKGFRELYHMGLIDRMPKLGIIQAAGCDPMVRAWEQGKAVADPLPRPSTHITTLATGNPGRTYTFLYEYVREHGGVFARVTDEEAFRAMHMLAKMEGLSVEPATAVAFAGLIQLVREGVIQPHEVVVVNATGHTMPIESHILGDRWARHVVLAQRGEGAAAEAPQEGLVAALSNLAAERYPRVLIVEDHEPARVLLRRILQSLGDYTILEAKDGYEALEIAQREVPDLIILDLMMPGLDGFAVLDSLKAHPNTAHIPVIVVTAKSLNAREQQRLLSQQAKLMYKGEFLSDEFLNEIRSVLAQIRNGTGRE
ncbi:MAG: pyridoxal-phosphate dependent enzyme [Chloroflexi bacterium]|nr:pyridoxal-phosphate dependent enzyme [Chloroflexota bacterium]